MILRPTPGDFIIFDSGAEYLLREKKIGTRMLADHSPSELLGGLWDGTIHEHKSGILLPAISGGADFLGFNVGRIIVEDVGWPATVYFDLSTGVIGSTFVATTAYASRLPITGTSYTNKNQAQPTPTTATLGQLAFTLMSWATGAATDWTNPTMIVATDNSASLFCAWNLVAGGAARTMNQANTTLNVTPTYLPTNPP